MPKLPWSQEYEGVHKNSWSREIRKSVKPIYEDLSRDDLLERRLGCHSQNNNESLHSTVWRLAPKSGFCGTLIVETATNLGTITFNEGQQALLLLLRALACKIERNCHEGLRRKDQLRMEDSDKRLSTTSNPPRRYKKQSDAESCDGDDFDYGPGIDCSW